jgi:hypothetical protein
MLNLGRIGQGRRVGIVRGGCRPRFGSAGRVCRRPPLRSNRVWPAWHDQEHDRDLRRVRRLWPWRHGDQPDREIPPKRPTEGGEMIALCNVVALVLGTLMGLVLLIFAHPLSSSALLDSKPGRFLAAGRRYGVSGCPNTGVGCGDAGRIRGLPRTCQRPRRSRV